MALMNDQKIDKRSKAYKDSLQTSNETSVNAPQEQVSAEPIQTQNSSPDPRDLMIQQLQSQLERMEKRLDNVDRPKTDWEAASKHYSGPRMYNYRLWDGKPICSAITKKKDSTKPLVDRTGESNHLLELTFHDGTTADVNIDDFGANFVHSEKMYANIITDPRDTSKVVGYTFETKEFGTFTVVPGMIN